MYTEALVNPNEISTITAAIKILTSVILNKWLVSGFITITLYKAPQPAPANCLILFFFTFAILDVIRIII